MVGSLPSDSIAAGQCDLTKDLFEIVDLAPMLEHTVMKPEPQKGLFFRDGS